jgi:peptidyl-prolyl cis-trans isomerase A (cyclophilin A)
MKALLLLVTTASLALSCQSAPPEPTTTKEESRPGSRSTASAAAPEEPRPAPPPPRPPAVQAAPDDPLKGAFTLEDATKGIAGSGPLTAILDTDLGKLECKLFEDKAPITVANFVGLARGIRPWKDPNGEWVKKAAYDGTVFHRIIKGFMIQGGDAKGTGSGEPGYVIPDEVWPGAKHDRAGLLCMANRGKNTNGAQFFITDAAAAHLDGGYTIFGECGPEALVHKLAGVDVVGEKPKTPPKIKSVKIQRGK